MPRSDYNDDEDNERQADAVKPVTCSRCGADDCYWQEVWTNAGVKHNLFEDGKPHRCQGAAASLDEFDEVPGG